MKKYLVVVLALLVLVPNFVFAAWWNPTSWSIFSFIFHRSSQVEMISATTPPQTFNNNLATATSPQIRDGIKENVLKLQNANATPADIESYVQSAVQESGQTPNTLSTPQKNSNNFSNQTQNTNICEKEYGPNSLETGTVSNGGPACGCASGYSWNGSYTKCVTPVEACSEINGDWDGEIINGEASCNCKLGYVLNSVGTTCQISNTSDFSPPVFPLLPTNQTNYQSSQIQEQLQQIQRTQQQAQNQLQQLQQAQEQAKEQQRRLQEQQNLQESQQYWQKESQFQQQMYQQSLPYCNQYGIFDRPTICR